ncbi:MAG TPA: hypothetical protein VJ201_02635 [Candidatus Babeliales bacterium]|nr:hypothetical protein [Candidatus Babeliales bacterium]
MNIDTNHARQIAEQEAKRMLRDATRSKPESIMELADQLFIASFKKMPLEQLYNIRGIMNKIIGIKEQAKKK